MARSSERVSKKSSSSNKTEAVATETTTQSKRQKKTAETDTTTASVAPAQVPEQTNASSSEQSSEMKFMGRFNDFARQLEEMREQFRHLTSFSKKLAISYNQDVNRVSKRKPKRNPPSQPTGFIKQMVVPERLAKFIGVPAGSSLSGPEITSKVWEQMRSRNLVYSEDKRVLRTNKEVSAVFGVPESVNKSTHFKDPNGFNFCTIQKFIANVLNSDNATNAPAPTNAKEALPEVTPQKKEKKSRNQSNTN